MLRWLLSALLILTAIAPGWPALADHEAPVPIPVILVHGWGQNPEDAWGSEAGRGGSMRARLASGGYPDSHVALLDWSGQSPDYVSRAGDLASLIDHVTESTGAEAVDVVTDCMGALIARALIAQPGQGGRIRTLVMISPPNRGSEWVQDWGGRLLLHEIEAMRRAEGRYRAGHAPIWDPPEAIEVTEYVYWRAYYLFEPLFGDYVWTERLTPGPPTPSPVDFPGWFRTRYPAEFNELFLIGRGGLLPLPASGGLVSLPRPEAALDLAYLDLLALEAGAHLYRNLMSPVESLTRDWMRDIRPSETWQETALRFILLRAARFAGEVGWPWFQFMVREGAYRLLPRWSGWDSDLPWPALVPETVAWPEERGASIFMPANLALTRMNERERMVRHTSPGDGPRFLTIVPEAGSGPVGLSVNLVGDGGLSMLPVRPGDAVIVLPGDHVDPWRRDVQVAVLDWLVGRARVTDASLPWQGYVGVLAPLALRPAAQGDILIGAVDVPDGYRLAAWPGDDVTGAVLVSLKAETPMPISDRLCLQLVAVRPPPPRSYPSRSDVAAVQLLPAHSGVEDELPAVSHPGHPEKEGEYEEVPGPPLIGGAGTDDAPLITVIRTSRMTTTKKERRIVHHRWEWEWGKGQTWTDPQLDVPVGTFRLPQGNEQLQVIARSYAGDGRLLREITWNVGPEGVSGPDGAHSIIDEGFKWWEFRAESIREPEVQIHIDGPKSWVTGREAVYTVAAEVSMPPTAGDPDVYFYPAQTFRVLWERPGTFTVIAAVNLRFSYRLPERSVYVSVIYVDEIEVEVLATSVTQ